MAWRLSLVGGVEVGPVGCPWWDRLVLFFYAGVLCPRGPASPRYGRIFLVLSNAFGVGSVGLLSQ